MKYLPYQFVAVFSLMTAFFVGALLQAGGDYMKEMAYRQGQIDVLVSLPLEHLTKVDVEEYDL